MLPTLLWSVLPLAVTYIDVYKTHIHTAKQMYSLDARRAATSPKDPRSSFNAHEKSERKGRDINERNEHKQLLCQRKMKTHP